MWIILENLLSLRLYLSWKVFRILQSFICFFGHFWILFIWIYSFSVELFWNYVQTLSTFDAFSSLKALFLIFFLSEEKVFIETVSYTLFLLAKTLFGLFRFNLFEIYQIIIMSWKWFLFSVLLIIHKLWIRIWVFPWFYKSIFCEG
jgi:hypothetical protein